MSDALDLGARLARIPTSSASGILADLGVRRAVVEGVRRIAGEEIVAGPVRTIRFLPLREDLAAPRGNLQRATIDTLRAGEVLVIDALGFLRGAVLGDMLAARAKALGAVAVIADGVVRDSASFAAIGLTVFARGTYPVPWRTELVPWEADVAVQCGGVLVEPGDYAIADAEGVLIVPRALAEQVAERGEEMNARDAFSQQLIQAGHALDDAYPLPEHRLADYERYRRDGTVPPQGTLS